MSTRNDILSLNEKCSVAANTTQFSNLNLNQTNHCPVSNPIQSQIISNFSIKDHAATAKTGNESVVDIKPEEKRSITESWKKSSVNYALSNYLHLPKEKVKKKRWNSSPTNTTNSSTLSLHIAAYENSIEASSNDKDEMSSVKVKAKTVLNFAPKPQNPFEFSRQIEDKRPQKPEVMQFKASQRLLSPNQQEMSSNMENDGTKNGGDKVEEDTQNGETKSEKEEQEPSKQLNGNSGKVLHPSKSEDEKERKSTTKEEKDERPRKRRRYTHSSSSDSEDEDKNVKRPRRSEPTRRAAEAPSSSRVERRHFYSRRSEPLPLPEVSLKKLAAGEYPLHEIPTKWNLTFEPEDLTEIEPRKRTRPIIRMSSPQPITISSEGESSSSSPTKNLKVKSVIGNFWRVKPPFPRTKTIIAKDGTCLSLFFTDKYVFSNRFPADFTVNGITYSCSEQYYMRFKAVYFGDDEMAAQIMQTSDPKAMKRCGRQVEGFDEEKWKKVSLQVMKIGCYHKFTQNKALRYELFRTIDTTLVEASPMDAYWGVGLSMDNENIRNPKKWRGENLLGYILTKLRDHLKQQPEYQEEMKQVYTEFDPSVV